MLQILLIVFIILAVVSGLGISLLYLVKDYTVKTSIFCFLSVWSLLVAFINATALPSNYIIQQLIAWLLGFVSIIAIIVKLKNPKKANIAYFLVSASTLLSLVDLVLF